MKKKRRFLPSFLMIIGFVLFILSAIALPSADEQFRGIITVFTLGSLGLIVIGIILAMFEPRERKDR